MNHSINTNEPTLSIDIGSAVNKTSTIHTNVNQEIIVTTADKIELVLINTKGIINSQREWWTPFGLLISFITTLCTANFNDAFVGSQDFWLALFVFLTLFSLIWLIWTINKLIKNWGQDDLNKIIEQIKLKGQTGTDTNLIDNKSNSL